jgi:hypothetical protein
LQNLKLLGAQYADFVESYKKAAKEWDSWALQPQPLSACATPFDFDKKL